MPIYEYICEKCGSHIEVIQKINDEPLKRCTKCKGKLQKTLSRTSFQLKGSGWYATDYSPKDKSGKSETAKDKAEKTTDKKTEPAASKPVSADGD
jgi:putative FmdB family regulatory protein